MKRIVVAGILLSIFLPVMLSYAAPMAPMEPLTIEGTVKEISWQPDRFMKGLAGMSGSAGQDRTEPAHYSIVLKNTQVIAPVGDSSRFKTGDIITIKIKHPKNDGFLMRNMRIRIVDFNVRGDEGGTHTFFKRIDILNKGGAKP